MSELFFFFLVILGDRSCILSFVMPKTRGKRSARTQGGSSHGRGGSHRAPQGSSPVPNPLEVVGPSPKVEDLPRFLEMIREEVRKEFSRQSGRPLSAIAVSAATIPSTTTATPVVVTPISGLAAADPSESAPGSLGSGG